MGCGTSFVKYVLFFFNLVVALFGIAMIAVGVAVHLNWGVIKDELKGHLSVAPWVFIIIGAVTFIIAFFGCCGAIRESHCMVVTYAIFLLVIIIVQVVVAVLMFTYADTIRDGLVKSVDTLFDKRSQDRVSAEVFANIETQLECCGKNSVADYGLTPPASCCPQRGSLTGGMSTCTIADVYAINTTGCGPRVGALYDKWSKPLAGIAIGVACVEVVGALFALCLANSIRNMDRRSRY